MKNFYMHAATVPFILITFLFASHRAGEFKNTWCKEVPPHCFLMMTYSLCLFSVEISQCVYTREGVHNLHRITVQLLYRKKFRVEKFAVLAYLDEFFYRTVRRFPSMKRNAQRNFRNRIRTPVKRVHPREDISHVSSCRVT